jgi:hypothetical protein
MPKYNSADNILAKVFFEILHSKDYMKLKPKPNEAKELGKAGLKSIYDGIYDYYFVKSDNFEAKEFLRLSNSINAQEYKIKTIEGVLKLLFQTHAMPEFDELRNEWWDVFENDFGIPVNRDLDVLDIIQGIKQRDLGFMRNDLNMENMEYDALLKQITPDKKEYDYYASIVGLGNAMQGNTLVSVDMVLSVYIALENEAKRLSIEFKKKHPKK